MQKTQKEAPAASQGSTPAHSSQWLNPGSPRASRNQAQAKTPLSLPNLAFTGISLPLVIDELLLLGYHQLRIVLPPSLSRAAQTDSMTLTECRVRYCSIDLVSTNHFRVETMAAPIGHRLSLEVFSFVVGDVTKPIEEDESLTGDRY